MSPLLGYDTANHDFVVPGDAEFIVCYGDRLFENENAAHARFPQLVAFGRVIDLTADSALWKDPFSGDDIEPGNSGPDRAVGYVQGEHARGVERPVVYADISDMKVIINNLANAGIHIGAAGLTRPWRMYVAHPNGHQHICGPGTCGELAFDADITQFWFSSISGRWHGFTGDLDVNLARDDAFTPLPKPKPIIPKPPEDTMALQIAENHDGRLEVFVKTESGEIFHTWQLAPGGKFRVDDKGNVIWSSLGNPGK